MAASDSGVWKLFIISIALIMIIGGILTFVISPFVDRGISVPHYPNVMVDGLHNLVSTASPFSGLIFSLPLLGNIDVSSPFQFIYQWMIPQVARDYMTTQVDVLYLLPYGIQMPTAILIYAALLFAVGSFIAMFVP